MEWIATEEILDFLVANIRIGADQSFKQHWQASQVHVSLLCPCGWCVAPPLRPVYQSHFLRPTLWRRECSACMSGVGGGPFVM